MFVRLLNRFDACLEAWGTKRYVVVSFVQGTVVVVEIVVAGAFVAVAVDSVVAVVRVEIGFFYVHFTTTYDRIQYSVSFSGDHRFLGAQ